jgi:hypothetical protein
VVSKPEGKIPLERYRLGWNINIKIDTKEIGLEGVDWTYLAWDIPHWWTVMDMLMNLQVP